MLSRTQAAITFAVVLMAGLVFAQIPGGGVYPSGPITAGNCAKWVSTSLIADAGKVCGGSPPPGCNGVLDLSTGCSQAVAYGGLF